MTRFVATAACMLCMGCVTDVRPLSYDFSDQGRVEALQHAIDALAHAYAFTALKEIDWGRVSETLGPSMAAAEAMDDVQLYERVLRELVLAMPDGHVLLWHNQKRRNVCPEAAATFGLQLSDSDDDDIIVAGVAGDSSAQAAGIMPGDRVVSVNGQNVETALSNVPLHCVPVGLATLERQRQARVRLLGRAAVGAQALFTLNHQGNAQDIVLTAHADGDDVRAQLGLQVPTKRIQSRMLGSDVGYIAIGWEETILSEWEVGKRLHNLWDAGARRLVLDLRNNDGGTDQAAANIVGMFTQRRWFYETITMYDRRQANQAVISEVWVEPQEVFWNLPVVVLINGNTVSSGEGMAMMLARFGVEVVGFEGTAASFGSSGSTIAFPEGWELTWPAGRSLDRDGNIQLDSDATLQGGVVPTHRIPWTAANRVAWTKDPEGFEIDYAVRHVLGGL